MPRELLALVAEGLARLDPEEEPESLAGAVSTIFGQFHEFAASVTDFYTYIGSVLTRSDLDGEEWAGFKGLLLDYLESIVESVRRHSHAISNCLALLRPELPRLLDRISESDGAFAALQAASPGGEDVERARGRTRADWDQLEAWFIGPGARRFAMRRTGRSEPCSPVSNGSMPRRPMRCPCVATISSWRHGSTPRLPLTPTRWLPRHSACTGSDTWGWCWTRTLPRRCPPP